MVHTGDAEFEVRKRRKVDLISFDMVIKIKVVEFECSTEHSNISSYCFTIRNSVQKCINTSKIFEIMGSMSTPFVESKDERLRANISHLKFATFSYSTQIKDLKVAYHLPYR